jgi:hypothetical protein
MTLPSWFSQSLALAVYSAYLSTPTPTTIVLTTSTITVSQSDGQTFSCTPDSLLPSLEISTPDTSIPLETGSDLSSCTPALPDPPSIEPLQTAFDLADILQDLQEAPEATVPPLRLTATTTDAKVVQLLQQLFRSSRHGQRNRHLQLHLAYQLGFLQEQYPHQFKNQLDIAVNVPRTRRRITTAAKRIYKLGQLVGLSRLYGTQRLTYEQIKRMSHSDFDIILIPAMQAYQWPVFDYSEDLVFSDRPYETPGSDSSHDSEA